MIGIMLSLGGFKFSINTAAYESFSRSSNYRWQPQERFNQLPAQQFTGLSEDSITLSGVIYPQFAGGLHQIDSMRALAGNGKPLMLVDGKGFVWGKWCINSIDEDQDTFFSDGTARKYQFRLKITRYGADL